MEFQRLSPLAAMLESFETLEGDCLTEGELGASILYSYVEADGAYPVVLSTIIMKLIY